MNRLTDEQMDKIIKAKFKDDNEIPSKVNSVFENLGSKLNKDKIVNFKEKSNSIKNKTNVKNKSIKENNFDKKIVHDNFYKKINKILGIAAVTLTVILVGGTTIYLNNNSKKINNNEPEVIEYTKTYLVKNEKLKLSNETIHKQVENGYVLAYMLGKRDIGINLTSKYWNIYGKEVLSTDCYKVDGIDEDIEDIFIGEIGGYGVPYVFLLTEKGTIQYIDLDCYKNNVFYFTAKKLEGLDNVVGFEQKTRKYSYSDTDYEYVNAIRNDGLRKEIEIGVVNNWNDNKKVNYDKLNEKYINAHNGSNIINDNKGDFRVDNITYLSINGEKEYVYCKKNDKFYKVKRSDMSEQCLASGIIGYIRDNADGRLSVMLSNNYEIYSLDKNIVFKNRNGEIINYVNNNVDNKNEEESSDIIDGNNNSNVNYTEETNHKIIKKLYPNGWAGSSMQEIRLYDNGDVYQVTYNGEGNTEQNIISSELIAKNADTIEEVMSGQAVEGITIKGKNLEIVEPNVCQWISFKKD